MRAPFLLSSILVLAAGLVAAGCGAETTPASGAQAADATAADVPSSATDGANSDGTNSNGASTDAAAAPSDAAAVDAGPQQAKIEWKACEVDYKDVQAECATIVMPMDYSKPDGEGMPIHVARIKATKPRRGSLWLLQGGPGGDGAGLAPLAAQFIKKVPDLDVYLPDHRGTGLSDRLGCDKQEASNSIGGAGIVSFEWPGCMDSVVAQWGEGLNQFTPSNASRDLKGWIDATRQEGDEVLIYGVSYGTYWAHRFLQMYPKAATGVVLDSICPPGACVGDNYDVAFNKVGKVYLDLCGEDDFCSSKLGKDPWKRLKNLYTKLKDKNHCPNFTKKLPPSQLPMLFSALLRQVQIRAAIPAVIYRLDRCDPADELVLNKFLQLMQYMGGGMLPDSASPKFAAAKPISQVLNVHILLSEMWTDPAPAYEKVKADLASALIAPGATRNSLLLYNQWPRFKRDEFAGKFATTDTPILMLNGTLDPQTPDFYAQAMYDGVKGSKKRLILLPGAAHGTVTQSPMFSGGTCGMELTTQFFAAPTKKVDDSCLKLLMPIAFTWPAYMTQQFLGVTDLFENGKPDSLLTPKIKLPKETWTPPFELPHWW